MEAPVSGSCGQCPNLTSSPGGSHASGQRSPFEKHFYKQIGGGQAFPNFFKKVTNTFQGPSNGDSRKGDHQSRGWAGAEPASELSPSTATAPPQLEQFSWVQGSSLARGQPRFLAASSCHLTLCGLQLSRTSWIPSPPHLVAPIPH